MDPQALVGPLYVFVVTEQGRVVGEGGGKEKVKTTNMRVGQGSASSAPWKSLKIAVGAGKSSNFGANFIQPRFSSA